MELFLHHPDLDVRKIIRLERLHLKILKRKYSLASNRTCLNNGWLPSYTNIYIYIYIYFIHDVLLPTSLPNWSKCVVGQLKTWASTIKDDLAALSGPQVVGLRRWNRNWLAISCDLAQEQRTWATMFQDAVLAREEASSTRLRWKPIQVKSIYIYIYIYVYMNLALNYPQGLICC